MDYDVVIVGGGLAGLTAGYRILQSRKDTRLLILEKSDRVGGRIATIKIDGKNIELGASFVSVDIHKRTLQLMSELNFNAKDFQKIPSEADYALRHPYLPDSAHLINQVPFYKVNGWERFIVAPLAGSLLEHPETGLINVLSSFMKVLPEGWTNQYTLAGVLNRLGFSEEFINLLRDAFGFDSALDKVNATDALRYLKNFYPQHGFMSFNPGLSEFINRLYDGFLHHGGDILFNAQVVHLEPWEENSHLISFHDGKGMGKIKAKTVILALPSKDLYKLLPLAMSNSVDPNPLMRIYLRFPYAWFKGEPGKLITATPARMVFQMSEDPPLLQIYIDDRMAVFWDEHLKEGTLETTIMSFLAEIFPKHEIPRPIDIISNFCPYAAHWWKPGYDSKTVREHILQPFPNENVFICGEAFSGVQGWMEGAVTTAEQVAEQVIRLDESRYPREELLALSSVS